MCVQAHQQSFDGEPRVDAASCPDEEERVEVKKRVAPPSMPPLGAAPFKDDLHGENPLAEVTLEEVTAEELSPAEALAEGL